MLSLIQRVAAALLAPAVFGVVVPANVILRNLDEVQAGGGTFVFFATVFALIAAVTVPAALVSERYGWARAAIRAATGLAVTVMLWDVLALLAMSLGARRAPWAAAELLTAAIVVWSVWRLPLSLILRAAAAITPVVLAVTAADVAGALAGGDAPEPVALEPVSAAPVLPGAPGAPGESGAANAGNVYHIILDQYQTEAFAWALAKGAELKAYPLTFYPRFRSNAYATFVSNAILLGGRPYDGSSSPAQWIQSAFNANLFDWLKSAGAGLHLYPFYRYYCEPGADVCLSAMDLASRTAGGSAILIDLWFQRVVPRSPFPRALAPDDWDYGFSITSFLRSGSPRNLRREWPVYAVDQFDELLRSEAARPARGQYVFMHAILPHGPLVLGPDCQVHRGAARVPPWKKRLLYLDQVACANRLLARFMDELKRLGRFDDALIIVHSDHGRYFAMPRRDPLRKYAPRTQPGRSGVRFDPLNAESDSWPGSAVELRSSALLWIKWPHQRQFEVSDLPLQSPDIAPTVLRQFGLRHPKLPGEAIQSLPAGWHRVPEFLTYRNGPPPPFTTRPGGDMPKDFAHYRRESGRWRYAGHVGPR